jgi:tetratricopeptide (TPR) repeat protein
MVMAYNRSHSKVVHLTLEELLRLLAEEKNSRPNYGAILQYFRHLIGWTADELAFYYSEALGLDDAVITASWVSHMENDNKVPTDLKRRWILACLLGIPPMLFGLEPLERAISGLFTWEKVDVQEYHLTLENYSRGWHAYSVFQAAEDIKQRISTLYHEAPHALEKKEMYKLLCGYLVLLGGIAHAHMKFDAAIDYYSRAVMIAKQEKFYDLWAYALCERGGVYVERGELTTGLKSYETAQQYFAKAVPNAQAAQNVMGKVQPMLRGIILSKTGIAYASIAQDENEFKKALDALDQAHAYIEKKGDDIGIIGAILDEERYHLDRAHAYLAYPTWKTYHAKAAQGELEQATKKQTLNSLYRKTSYVLYIAKSYLVGGQYEMAIAYAEDALRTFQATGSVMKLVRLDAIYHHLRNDPSYGKSSDVALLGTKLLKAQQPGLFN